MDRNKYIVSFSVIAVVILVIVIVVGVVRNNSDSPYDVEATLTFWGVDDPKSYYDWSINYFNTVYRNVDIEYRRFNSVESYERNLLNALAEGEGPDIFMVRNNDLFRKINKISPVPQEKYSIGNLRSDFPEIVEENFHSEGNIYALPLSIDTLALMYNEDIFNRKSIVFPPENWEEFQSYVSEITELDEEGRVALAGAAMGGSDNIHNFKDIISILMIQSGTEMVTDSYSEVRFSFQGREAFNFYVSFGLPSSSSYTWGNYISNSREAFADGRVAMILDYQSAIPTIKSRNSFINMEVVPFPQPSNTEEVTTFANYWGYTVSSQSNNADLAWDFIGLLTTNVDSARAYMSRSNKPPALRTLINDTINDLNLGVFSRQILTATSWQEPDPERVSDIFSEMVENVTERGMSVRDSLNIGESEVTNIIKEN